MNKKTNVQFEAKEIPTILMALRDFKGRKSIMTAYRINNLIQPLKEMNNDFMRSLKNKVDIKGGMFRAKEEFEDEVKDIMEEIITLDIVPLQWADVENLQVDNSESVGELIRIGFLSEPES